MGGPLVASAAVVLYLLLLLLIGYAELRFLKSRGAAVTTWLLGISALAIVASQPVTSAHVRILFGVGVLLCGIAGILVFLRKQGRR